MSAYELGCLGLLHGTRARARRAMGMPDPEPISLTQEMLKRPTTGSLTVKPAWPRDLAILAIAAVAAAAMIAVVAMAKPNGPPSTTVALAAAPVVEQTPAVADTTPAVTPQPTPPEQAAVVATQPERPTKKVKKAKKRRKRKKARRKRRRR